MINKSNRILSWNDGNSLVSALVLGLTSLGLLTLLNSSLGMVPAMRALYILPIWLGTRLGGRLGGFILVSFATLANVWLDVKEGVTGVGTFSSGMIWLGVFSLVMLLVAQVEDALTRTEKLANLDPLTGLYNRRGLEIEGRRLVQRAAKNRDMVSVAMLDCDRFKRINDDFGHKAGDEALRFLAQTLRDNTRESDVLSRLGGDEFVLVLADTDQSEAQQVLERVQRAFDRGMIDRGFDSSLSIGLAQITADARDLRTLVAFADRQMYETKEGKRTAPIAS